MTTETSPAPAPSPLAPTARWRFERDDDGALQLLIWADPSGPVTSPPQCFPMRELEGRSFVRGADRVLSLAAPAVSGTFTPVPDPAAVASQLGAVRYRVVSPDVEAHVAIVIATPWATWTEQYPHGGGITAQATVFGGDSGNFLDLAKAHGVSVEPA